jgi:ribulose-bisphosphate carboxylase large chain
MKTLGEDTLRVLWHDRDAREVLLRKVVGERLVEKPAPVMDDYMVASYFFALRSMKLEEAVHEIAYHATSGTKHIPPGSLIEQCTGKAAGIDAFDSTGRIGILHMAFPLKMLLQPDGHMTSTDIMHTAANAIIFDVFEHQDARLVGLQIPEKVIRTFPGPAYGPKGLRKRTGFASDQSAFGTILKPTTGITPEQVGELIEEAAKCPLFMFIKEDENLYPNLDYSPVKERTKRAVAGIAKAREHRGGLGLVFAPHITGGPNEILESVHAVLDAGASGVMFSESFAGGTVRMVREATKKLANPPAIYGHNAGIGTRTWSIWREVIDLLARLDGIDFRQTAPVRRGAPFIYPYGAEWEASENALTKPLTGINPTMIARAGGLDQGNICANLADAERRGMAENILFLAGSAINSIKNAQGKADPNVGAEAMTQALEVHRSGELRDLPIEKHVAALVNISERKGYKALREALKQRYPGEAD